MSRNNTCFYYAIEGKEKRKKKILLQNVIASHTRNVFLEAPLAPNTLRAHDSRPDFSKVGLFFSHSNSLIGSRSH